MFTPSTYQQDIFDFIKNGRGDGMVSAVAGSGKTTTLVEAARLIKTDNAVFFAFNKHIAEELGRRLMGTPMQARTIHSLGFSCLTKVYRRLNLDDRKYVELSRKAVEQAFPMMMQQQGGKAKAHQYATTLKKLVDLSRLTLTRGVEEIMQLAEDHAINGVDPQDMARLAGLVEKVCRDGIAKAEYGKSIDFTDMVWLPLVLEIEPPKYDWVFVDEAQDLNAAQRELVLKCRAAGGRMLFVGDPRQAIMAFAGADAHSYEVIRERTQATELPLSICYRCPVSHIELAQAIVPEILPAPGAISGVIKNTVEGKVQEEVQEGDLILCRVTAPLVSMCIKLIRHRIPARVRGRDIAAQLVSLAKKVGEPVSFDRFLNSLESYREEMLSAYAKKKNPDNLIMVLNDTCDALEACYLEFQASDLDDLCRQIEGIFSDAHASVWLSTVHRAKGLEADRVFILKPHKLPLVWSRQTADQTVQEWNLRYVALTRAKKELTFVEEEQEKKEEGTEAKGVGIEEIKQPVLAGF